MEMLSGLLRERPHRRLNVLTGEWVFVSPHRLRRPWQGAHEPPARPSGLSYDPECYLCPGNARAGGSRNPPYVSTYVFDNDFPAFLPVPSGSLDDKGRDLEDPVASVVAASEFAPLLVARAQSGVCRVICYSPHHDQTLSQMSPQDIQGVIRVWTQQARELEARWAWVQIFENKGEQMGCSNPHPHGQLWAGDFIPSEAAQELRCQDRWFFEHRSPLLLDYATLERTRAERIIVENEHWMAVVPWWAAWPYETLLLPGRAVSRLTELSEVEQGALASLLRRLLQAYDRLFETPFPYSLGWHGAPGVSAGAEIDGRQLHAHVYSPLLRSAEVRKFMVGYEMLAETQRDLTPEDAAARLRRAARHVSVG